ncbi:M24 family metallopeptidase [Mycobacterium paragordonae]|uniref:M24 family metallopeptidase n=1 Tax=Mycobacterium paragordonae TaxID=1389713 RepID=A0AAJ1S167_9MYCO|nr:M24 family metallopeptidase [Mycobacterium paragordonae]MDP7734249.1 M24 family metallopeptidase [Mycobacterium paragordonae]
MSLEDSCRVDFAALRAERRAKVFSGMESHGLDALVLGGAGNVHYVCGARVLGRAGVLPFAPVCVVVRSTGRVHLLSTWDEGVPPEIEREDLYPLSWDPANLMRSVASIPGLRESRRAGTDGLTASTGAMVVSLASGAELVDGGAVVEACRRVKTDAEITCLEVAAAISESALSAMSAALGPGVSERELLGVYSEHVAQLGAPVPPSESVCFSAGGAGPVEFRSAASDRVVGDGEMVVLAPGALYAGYEAGLARTVVAGSGSGGGGGGGSALGERCAAGMDALVGACRAGGVGADLYRAWERAGVGPASVVLAHGLGLGAEPPVIGLGLGRDAVLEEGMVLSVQSWVADEGVGGCLQRDTVVIDASGPVVLTRYGRP